MSENFPALQVEHLTVNYDRVSVLWDITFSLPRGVSAAIIGPNGAGKSTFMKAILGLVKPLNGTIRILGLPHTKQFKKIAYIPQRESIDWDFPITVEELVLQGRYAKMGLFSFVKKSDIEAVKEVLKLVDMEGYAKRQINQLSIGQQQRIFLARALLLEAEIYFMDEPFSGVDSVTEKFIFDFFQKLKEQGKTVIVIHHNIKKVQDHFDWVIMLNVNLIASGPIQEQFNEANLQKTFGQSPHLFEEVFHLSKDKTEGNRCSY